MDRRGLYRDDFARLATLAGSLMDATPTTHEAPLPKARPSEPDAMSWKELIEVGDYKRLGARLRESLDLERVDPKLRRVVEQNLAYLERGAKAATPGSEIVIVRAAPPKAVFPAEATSGGAHFMLAGALQLQRTPWDERLRVLTPELAEENHAAETGAFLYTTTQAPTAANFKGVDGTIYVIKVSPERVQFTDPGSHSQVFVPFWILPHEIVAAYDNLAEALRDPLYRVSWLKDVPDELFPTLEEKARAGLDLRAALDPDRGLVRAIDDPMSRQLSERVEEEYSNEP
jgi:hypothetical protein